VGPRDAEEAAVVAARRSVAATRNLREVEIVNVAGVMRHRVGAVPFVVEEPPMGVREDSTAVPGVASRRQEAEEGAGAVRSAVAVPSRGRDPSLLSVAVDGEARRPLRVAAAAHPARSADAAVAATAAAAAAAAVVVAGGAEAAAGVAAAVVALAAAAVGAASAVVAVAAHQQRAVAAAVRAEAEAVAVAFRAVAVAPAVAAAEAAVAVRQGERPSRRNPRGGELKSWSKLDEQLRTKGLAEHVYSEIYISFHYKP
jgi:hypothetical protein